MVRFPLLRNYEYASMHSIVIILLLCMAIRLFYLCDCRLYVTHVKRIVLRIM
jgi:hypothetical protein